MYTRILVPLDGSQLAERALPLAASLARKSSASLLLTRSVYLASETAETFSLSRRESLDKAEAYLRTTAAPLIADGLHVDVVVNYTEAADGILEEIDVSNVDLVVMTTHGRSGFGRLRYGSVAESVLAHSPVPVILVRSGPNATSITLEKPHLTLLVPLDGSSFSEEALPHAIQLAQALQAEIALLHVYETRVIDEGDFYTKPDSVGQKFTQNQDHIATYVSELAHQLRDAGLAVRPTIRPGDVIQAILEESWADHASMVVMATHGRSGLRRSLFGSVALDVLRYGDLPVMLVRPAGFRAEPESTEHATALPM